MPLLRSCLLLAASLTAFAAEVSFTRDIAPILSAKCLACHDSGKAKGGYRVHTYEALLTPGKSGEEPVAAGDPDASELFARLVTPDEDDRMPQKDERLPEGQIDLFRRWIAEGARLDEGSSNAPLASLLPATPHPAPPERYDRPVPVLALAWNGDASRLAIGGYNEVLLCTREGALLKRITNVAQRVHAACFSPDGRFLVAAGGEPGRSGEAAVYELSSGERKETLLRSADVQLCAAFDPAGKTLAIGGTDNAVHIFDWETRTEIRVIQQHADWVHDLQFSADGSELASASRDRTARVYKVATGELEASYTGHGGPVFAAAFIGEGRVASAGRDRSIHFWKIEDSRKTADAGAFDIDVLRMASSGEHLFCISGRELRQYKIGDRSLVRAWVAPGALSALALHPNEPLAATGSFDGSVRVWNTASGELIHEFTPARLLEAAMARALPE